MVNADYQIISQAPNQHIMKVQILIKSFQDCKIDREGNHPLVVPLY
jgi:hypothetical protein